MSISVVFLGPCYKQDNKTQTLHEPFSDGSRSGRFLRSIWDSIGFGRGIRVSFANIIPKAVFDTTGRERNPKGSELLEHITSKDFWERVRGDIVVGLSADVRQAFELREHRPISTGEAIRISDRHFIFFEHPSFVMRQPIDRRQEYAERLKIGIRRTEALVAARVRKAAVGQAVHRRDSRNVESCIDA